MTLWFLTLNSGILEFRMKIILNLEWRSRSIWNVHHWYAIIIAVHILLLLAFSRAELWIIFISCTAWKVSKYGVFSGPYFPAFGLFTFTYTLTLFIFVWWKLSFLFKIFSGLWLHKKWSFPLKISSVNVTKSRGFGHIYWRNP